MTPLSAGASSNEDLSDSTESIQKSRVNTKTKLKKFFARRPTMEVLVKKGIYKGSAIILIGVRLFQLRIVLEVSLRVKRF